MKHPKANKQVEHKSNFKKRYASNGKGMEPNGCRTRWPGTWEGFRPGKDTTKAMLKRWEAWKDS